MLWLGCGLDFPELDYTPEQVIFLLFKIAQTGCGTNPSLCSIGILVLCRDEAAGLAPTLRMSGTMPLLREQEHDIQSAWIVSEYCVHLALQ